MCAPSSCSRPRSGSQSRWRRRAWPLPPCNSPNRSSSAASSTRWRRARPRGRRSRCGPRSASSASSPAWSSRCWPTGWRTGAASRRWPRPSSTPSPCPSATTPSAGRARGAHHPVRHRRPLLDLARVLARAARGGRRHPVPGADRDLHGRAHGRHPRRARARLSSSPTCSSRLQDLHRPGGRRALPRQGLRPRRRRARQRHRRAELCAARRRGAGHAHDHGRPARRAISGADLVGPAHRADAHGGDDHHGRGVRGGRAPRRARRDLGRRDRGLRRLRQPADRQARPGVGLRRRMHHEAPVIRTFFELLDSHRSSRKSRTPRPARRGEGAGASTRT